MRTFKLVPYDEVNDTYLLKERKWCFWRFVSAGSKKKLTAFVLETGGVLL